MFEKKMKELTIYKPRSELEVLEGYELVRDLYSGYFSDGLGRREYCYELSRAIEDPKFFAYFAKQKGSGVVGVILFRLIPFIFSGEGIWIHSLIVKKSHRRSGVGTKLFHECKSVGNELGLNRIYFNSASEILNADYAGTELFHEKLGSKKIGSFFVNELM